MAKRKSGWTRVAECIYRRNSTYQVRLNNPATGRKETFGPDDGVVDRESAFRVRDEQRAQHRLRARRRGREDETIGQFYDRWFDDFRGRAETTRRHYKQQIASFIDYDAHTLDPEEFVEGVRVGDLAFRQFTKKMARRYAAKEPSRSKAISAMFGDAMEDELIDANPFHRLGLRRTQGRKELVAITRQELELLAECARREQGQMFEAMVLTAAWTGVRPGELFVLRWADIDWDRNRIFVRRQYRSKTKEIVDYSKTGDQRRIVLPSPLWEPLQRLRDRHDRAERGPGREDDLFSTNTGEQFYSVLFQYYWNPVRASFQARVQERDPGRARLLFERANGEPKPMDFYELRHFCATYLLERGVPAHQVAVQLGHKDNGALVLSTYGHPSEDAALDAVDAAFGA